MYINVLWCTSDTSTCKACRALNMSNQHMSNMLIGHVQSTVADNRSQWDLGIIITKDLKWQKQTEKSCRTANRVLGFIARNFRCKNKEQILSLYKSLVSSHLEHAVQFWSKQVKRDIDKMGKIQRRATKMISEIRNHSYHQRI